MCISANKLKILDMKIINDTYILKEKFEDEHIGIIKRATI